MGVVFISIFLSFPLFVFAVVLFGTQTLWWSGLLLQAVSLRDASDHI